MNELLRAGADVTATEVKFGSTPLHTAAFAGHVAAAEALLVAGASPNARNANQLTPLHYAASGGHTELIALLLRYNASAHARSREGRTPLDKAGANEVAASQLRTAMRAQDAAAGDPDPRADRRHRGEAE